MNKCHKILLMIGEILAKKNDFIIIDEEVSDLDWEAFFNLSIKHKMLTMSYYCLKDKIPKLYYRMYEDKVNQIYSKTDFQLKEINNLQNSIFIENKSMNPIIVKGIPLSYLIYDSIYMRQSSDIDILLKNSDLFKVYDVVNKLGYKLFLGYDASGNAITSDTPILLYNENFHELQCKKDASFIELKKATSAIPYKFINEFIQNTEVMIIDSIKVTTFDQEHSLIHLFANTYNNFELGWSITHHSYLRDLIDIYVFVSKFNHIDWRNIHLLSIKYEMTHKIYYILKCLEELYGKMVEDSVLNMFDVKDIQYSLKIYENGSMNIWESSFLDRLFDDESRRKQHFRSHKKIIYSHENKSIHPIQNLNTTDVMDICNYIVFRIDEYHVVKYFITYDKDSIAIFFYDSNGDSENIFNYTVRFVFVTDNLESDTFEFNYDVNLENRNYAITYSDNEHKEYNVIEMDQVKLITFRIPYNEISFYNDTEGKILSYNIILLKSFGSAYKILQEKYFNNEGFLCFK